MITIISPAKNLDFKRQVKIKTFTQPIFLKESERLIRNLRKLKPADLTDLMGISDKLAVLNYERFQIWSQPFTNENARQAVLAFNGEVYNGLNAKELNEGDLKYAQDHLRILSGLHGILRPLDLIQAYRLEMGTELEVGKHENLYTFWSNKIHNHLREKLMSEQNPVLINLASNEYSKVTKLKKLKARVITPVFYQLKGDEYKMIVVYAKKARGMMTRYIIKNRIDDPEQLKLFDAEGYFYNENISDDKKWVFCR
jgi:cytoplasmic iron level regulating protein YaaA (DUF328/UPF0246 family)